MIQTIKARLNTCAYSKARATDRKCPPWALGPGPLGHHALLFVLAGVRMLSSGLLADPTWLRDWNGQRRFSDTGDDIKPAFA